MRKIKLVNIDDLSVESLKKIKKSIPKELRNRVQTIILIMQGWQAKQVAQFFDLTDQTVRRYIRSFNEGGIKKLLYTKPKPGRKPKLTDKQKEEIIQTIKKSPCEIGFGIGNVWYYNSIAAYIKEMYGVEITDEAVRLMIRKLQLKSQYDTKGCILSKRRMA